MIDLSDAIRIQEILIDRFGGSKGVRDIKLTSVRCKESDFH